MKELFNLGDLIDTEGARGRTALIDLGGEGGPREFSHEALDELIRATARALATQGLQRGDRIAILSANRCEYLAVCCAAMQAGLVPVPVNHRFPREMSDFVITDSGARMVFCDAERLAACPPDLPAVVFGDQRTTWPAGTRAFDDFTDPVPFEPVTPAAGEPAMFLYTSGSTGRPKGVVLSHQSHLWVVGARRRAQDVSAHRFLIAAPLYHMNALGLSQLAIAAGATIVLLPQFTSLAYIDAISRYRCTWLTAVPPMVAMMLRERDALQKADLSSVAYLRMGSAPVSPSLLAAIHEALPQAVVLNAYGSTEAGPVIFGPHPDKLPQPPLSVGYPHPEVQMRLVDGDDLNARQGVLQLRSPALMQGYHNRPEMRMPFTDDGYYVSGDVFRRDDDGFHYFVGRTDDMFVCGGENVFPGEVEKLLESHPDVAQACVVPIDDDIKGAKPVAFCVLREGATLTEEALKHYTLAHAPAYRHPRFIWFENRLPLAATSKIDRKALQALARQRARL
ncbi:class I adenylate-forming enzyme family protein [Pseudorhodoferax sp.]|uniref:class I adenylate-forming enzyme family protein n=1 Tax=Pseudorhodoferax sp. TaxID=1993553 RepID=UPI002DD6712D|nr:class I adenylate-forming enzyme family protein [Pseudorhodoferax sp.]